MKRGEKEDLFFIGVAFWGLIDTYKTINKNVKNGKIVYEFYNDFFEVKTEDIILKVDYEVIEKIITENEVYYIILEKCGLFMDKNNFTIGEKDEILNFLKMKDVLVI